MKMPTRTLRLTLFLLIIKNIYEFISRKKRKLFKNFLPKFLLLPKKTELPKIWGGLQPSPPPASPPGPYAYGYRTLNNVRYEVPYDVVCVDQFNSSHFLA